MKEKKKDYTNHLNIKDFSCNIFTKNKYKKQRAKFGFCDYDAMDIDVWFLNVMPRMIEHLRDNHTGYPMWILSEYYEQNKNILNMSEQDFCACLSNEYEYKKKRTKR